MYPEVQHLCLYFYIKICSSPPVPQDLFRHITQFVALVSRCTLFPSVSVDVVAQLVLTGLSTKSHPIACSCELYQAPSLQELLTEENY